MHPLDNRLLVFCAGMFLAAASVFGFDHTWANAVSNSGINQPHVQNSEVVAPLPPPVYLERDFQAPLTEFGSGHRGVDLLTTDGATVLSPVAGEVVYQGIVATKPELTVQDSSGHRFSFEPVCGLVPVGNAVRLGQVIGEVCGAGYNSHCAPLLCLHWSERNQNGYLSPLWLLGSLGPSRLVA